MPHLPLKTTFLGKGFAKPLGIKKKRKFHISSIKKCKNPLLQSQSDFAEIQNFIKTDTKNCPYPNITHTHTNISTEYL